MLVRAFACCLTLLIGPTFAVIARAGPPEPEPAPWAEPEPEPDPEMTGAARWVSEIPSLASFCQRDAKLESFIVPSVGIVDFAEVIDDSERNRDQHWSRVVTGAKASALVRSRFSTSTWSAWCRCAKDPQRGTLDCSDNVFEHDPEMSELGADGSERLCFSTGTSHGGELLCFVRVAEAAPWRLLFLGLVERGADPALYAQIDAAMTALVVPLRRTLAKPARPH